MDGGTTFKLEVKRDGTEETIWLNEFSSFDEAREKIGQWIEVEYNKLYVHSELGYKSPEEFERLYYNGAIKEAA